MYVAGDEIEFIKTNGTKEQRNKALSAFVDFYKKVNLVLSEILQQSVIKEKRGRTRGKKKSAHLRLVKP